MIDISVEDGVVTLDGDVPVLGLKRLTGVSLVSAGEAGGRQRSRDNPS